MRSVRHFAHNDRRKIADLERRVDRLITALARYGTHTWGCGARYESTLSGGARACDCGLTGIIKTRGVL